VVRDEGSYRVLASPREALLTLHIGSDMVTYASYSRPQRLPRSRSLRVCLVRAHAAVRSYPRLLVNHLDSRAPYVSFRLRPRSTFISLVIARSAR